MASKSSKLSTPSDPGHTIIVDDLPYKVASVRSRSKCGWLRIIGSISSRKTSSSKKSSSKFASSSKAKTSATPRFFSKTRDSNEPLPEPLVSKLFHKKSPLFMSVRSGPEDDRDRGCNNRFVAVPTRELVGEENMPFPDK